MTAGVLTRAGGTALHHISATSAVATLAISAVVAVGLILVLSFALYVRNRRS
jgi:hypothetical protein